MLVGCEESQDETGDGGRHGSVCGRNNLLCSVRVRVAVVGVASVFVLRMQTIKRRGSVEGFPADVVVWNLFFTNL